MTPQFLEWFGKNFSVNMFPEGEEREEIMTYTWLAWRDALRQNSDK